MTVRTDINTEAAEVCQRDVKESSVRVQGENQLMDTNGFQGAVVLFHSNVEVTVTSTVKQRPHEFRYICAVVHFKCTTHILDICL